MKLGSKNFYYLTCKTKGHYKHYFIGILEGYDRKYVVCTAYGSIDARPRAGKTEVFKTFDDALHYAHAVATEKLGKGYQFSIYPKDSAAPDWWMTTDGVFPAKKTEKSTPSPPIMKRTDAAWNF